MSNNPLPNYPSHYPNFPPSIYINVPSLKQKSGGLISFKADSPIPLDLSFNNIIHQTSLSLKIISHSRMIIVTQSTNLTRRK